MNISAQLTQILEQSNPGDFTTLAKPKDFCFSPFGGIPDLIQIEAMALEMAQDLYDDRAMGVLVGLACGDALGAPLEFLPVNEAKSSVHNFSDTAKNWYGKSQSVIKYEGPNNPFQLKTGQWSDDTSMALCLADSLLFNGAELNEVDLRIRFYHWLNYGYCNAFKYDDIRYSKYSVGLGGNIGKSLRSLMNESPITPRYISPTPSSDSGNGSIMRLAPIPIYYRKDEAAARRYARLQSYTTHPGEIAAEASDFLAFLCVRMINRSNVDAISMRVAIDFNVGAYLDAMPSAFATTELQQAATLMRQLLTSESPLTSTEACWNWRNPVLPLRRTMANRGDSYNGYPNSAGYFGSYALDALAMALHAVYQTNSFSEAIVKVINFLGDADSTAAVTGQIAGAYYGYSGIPVHYRAVLSEWDRGTITLRAMLLCNR